MAQFLRPDGDTALGGWSDPSFSVIDEVTRNDSDETTTGSSPSSDTLEVSTSDASTPDPGTRTFRYTYKKTGTRQEDLIVELREGSTVVETNTHTDIGTSYVQNNHTVTNSITDYANVNFRFIANSVGGGAPSTVQVSWAELELPDAAPEVPLTLNLADNMLALADSEIINIGYEIPKGDNLNNLGDSLLLLYEYILRPSETINNLADDISKILGYHIRSVDILTQFDSIAKNLEHRLILSEDIKNLLDASVIRRLHPFKISIGDLFTLTDNLDGVELNIPLGEDQQVVIRLLI